MENQQYEKHYREAREALARRGKRIGKLVYLCGIRYCDFEGLLVADHDIFAQAWSEAIADEIIHEHGVITASGGSPGPVGSGSLPSCSECELLFLGYAVAHESYLELLRRATDPRELSYIDPEALDASRERRNITRLAVIEHGATHHSLTKTA